MVDNAVLRMLAPPIFVVEISDGSRTFNILEQKRAVFNNRLTFQFACGCGRVRSGYSGVGDSFALNTSETLTIAYCVRSTYVLDCDTCDLVRDCQ